MKQANLIMYKPGYGGHFISSLLSLDSTTIPWISNPDIRKGMWCFLDQPNNHYYTWVHDAHQCQYTTSELVKMYSFANVTNAAWHKHHDSIPYELDVLEYFLTHSNRSVCTFALHPHGFFNNNEVNIIKILKRAYSFNLNYLQISLSSKYEYVIDAFKQANNGFPVLRPNEGELNVQFNTEYNPFVINFDNFILGEDTFVPEYERITTYLNLPQQTNIVLKLYRDWYAARKFSSLVRPPGIEPGFTA